MVENFDQAVNDFKQGLIIHERLLEDSSRILAESFYKYALALEFSGKFEEARDSLKKATSVLQKRCEFLKNQEGANNAAADEIADIESLFPDIEAKIEDLKVLEAQTIQDRKTLLETAENLLKQGSTPLTFDDDVDEEKKALEEKANATVEDDGLEKSKAPPAAELERKGKNPLVVNDLTGLVRKKAKLSTLETSIDQQEN